MKYTGIVIKLLDDDRYYYCITRYVKLLVTYMIKNDSLIRLSLVMVLILLIGVYMIQRLEIT